MEITLFSNMVIFSFLYYKNKTFLIPAKEQAVSNTSTKHSCHYLSTAVTIKACVFFQLGILKCFV